MTTASNRYQLYGLVLEGAIPLACPSADSSVRTDVHLRRGRARRFEHARRRISLPKRPQWFEARCLEDGATYLRWAGLFEFLISADGQTIEYCPLDGATDESLTTYLLGQVLSFSLLSRGYEPLHATAVVIDGEAVAFLGDCGYGKSTLGAAFLARGFAVLTDDVLSLEMLDGRWVAHAGPPRLKLFPSVAKKILARSDGAQLNAGTSKLLLPLAPMDAASHPIPLRALYVLPRPGLRSAATRITPLNGQNAFVEIIRAAFNLIRVDRERLAHQFMTATELVRHVPVRRLSYPRRLSRLGDVCSAVLEDAAELRRTQPRSGKTN